VNVCGDVVLALYGPEADDTPTQPTAASDTLTAGGVSVELNIPEILVHN